eukprot:TRINITY_DN7555_c0_g1_i2.p1 TRINITY_DN7555_c0_g1~~TRINITY_DN7555_c0_g1_i2.p1  ORF type:complete len:471 (-),score=106.15 TRINITY_DN7555_c0_g1_i2:78-1490(-)
MREQQLKLESARIHEEVRTQAEMNNKSLNIENQIHQKLELQSQRNISLEEERRQLLDQLREKDSYLDRFEENRLLQDQLLKESHDRISQLEQELNLTGQIRNDLEAKIKDIADELVLIKQRNEAWVYDAAQQRNQMEQEIQILENNLVEKDNQLDIQNRRNLEERRMDKEALITAQKECQSFQYVANATKEENIEQEQEIKTCHEEIVFLKNELSEQRDKNMNLFQQIQKEQEIKNDQQSILHQKEANINNIENEKKQLQNQLLEKEKIIQSLENEYVNATQEIQQKRKALNNLQEHVSTIESQSNLDQTNNENRVNKLLRDYMNENEKVKVLEQNEKHSQMELNKLKKINEKSEQEKNVMAEELAQMKIHISEVHDYVQNFIEVKCREINDYHTKINKLSILEDIKKMIKEYKTTGSARPSQREYFTIPANKTVNSFKKSVYGSILKCCLLYTSPSPRDRQKSRMPSSA